jgi:glycyl-tRNA synthetase beta chain
MASASSAPSSAASAPTESSDRSRDTSIDATASLLLEIGCEELPSSFVDGALAALPALVSGKLAALRIPHGEVRALGTARRLSVLVHDVRDRQLDLDEEVLGPPETAAYKDGAPTRAAEAFAQKLGIAVSALRIEAREAVGKQKAGRYVIGRRQETGRDADELLGPALGALCGEIPFRKSMRWGAGDATFGRPVQWLVALYGDKVLDVRFAGVTSGGSSRGHRFLAPAPFDVPSADAYVASLRDRHVLVDRDERARTMMERVIAAATAAGGTYDPEPSLVDENASLVEEPHVVTGSFDAAFLALPAAVIRSVARGHQKYFCVQKDADTLLPHYLCVANTANDPQVVAKGNDRVMRARLSDARFFFEEDKKVSFEARVEKLGGIVFHNRLGTVRQKVDRLVALTAVIARDLGLPAEDAELAARAARLCKADLVALMVGEFPELQGEMGRAYALAAGEDPQVADAIRDHYKPTGARDDVAPTDIAAVVGLADRLDTLVGCFAVGLSPTGAADPFALRRACLGILRTLMDKGQAGGTTGARFGRVDWRSWLGAAHDGFAGTRLDLTREETVAKVELFAAERLRGVLAGDSSTAVAEAVLTGVTRAPGTRDAGAPGPGSGSGPNVAVLAYPAIAVWKARELAKVVDAGALGTARTVAKRLRGIAGQAKPVFHQLGTAGGDADDAAIATLVQQIDAETRELASPEAIARALHAFGQVADTLEQIFLRKLINDPKDPATPQRLELLSYGADCMLRLGDFSRLG